MSHRSHRSHRFLMILERTAVAVMLCCRAFCAHASMAPNPLHPNTTSDEDGSL